jgi:Uncharacterized protein conserved in bacteria (DUF2188)
MDSVTTLHVTPARGGEWAVKINETAGASSVHPSQSEAVAKAWELVHDLDGAEVVVHGADGQVRSSLTIRQVGPPMEVLRTSGQGDDLDEAEDVALRAEAERITPSGDRLKAMISRRAASTIDYSLEDDELPC